MDQHPNLTLLQSLDLQNLAACSALFSDDFVWHYFNPNLPDVEGDYVGVDGLKRFFGRLAEKSEGTFRVEPVTAVPMGPELVVVQVRNILALDGEVRTVNAVVVWRIVDGKFTEAWDIPSAFSGVT